MHCPFHHFNFATMNNQNPTQPFNVNPTQAGVATHIVYNNGTLNFSRYLDPAMTPPEGIHTSTPVDNTEGNQAHHSFHNYNDSTTNNNLTTVVNAAGLGLVPNKQHASNSESLTKEKNSQNDFRTANGHEIPLNKRKSPYQIPVRNPSKIVTPRQTDKVHEPGTTNDSALQSAITATNNLQVDQGTLAPPHGIVKLPHTTQFSIYDSTLLNKKFKPNPMELILDYEIEPLRPLILSQHEAFTQTIKDLGITSTTLTKIIEKKKESCQQITDKNKIPRSLRLKCTLTTSPSYVDNPDFLRLKEKLQEKTDIYIKEGTEIMAEWAAINIQLLSEDRCHDILVKALQILDGLVSYSSEIIGVPNWPSAPNNNLTPLLLKLYLSNQVLDISNLANYLELSPEKILQIGIKILMKQNSHEQIRDITDNLNLTDIDMTDDLHNTFVRETLLNFDQILRFTTIHVWEHYENLAKQETAGNNLLIKMKTAETLTATEATGFAIAKATSNIQKDNESSLSSNLRIDNLERSLKRQEQQTNEILNITKRSKTQKNSTGSQHLESLASPPRSTPTNHKNKNLNKNTQRIVDLTKDTTDVANEDSGITHSNHHKTQQRTKRNQKEQKTKSIKWKKDTVTKFNPEAPVSTTPQNPFQKTSSQVHPVNTGAFLHPNFQNPPFPYTHPYFFALPTPFHQSLSNPFTLNTKTNTLPHPMDQLPNYYPLIQNQQTIQPRNNLGNPFGNPFQRNH